jgi:hypothetical protein
LWRGEQGEQLERMAQSDGNASGVVKARHLAERVLRQALFDKLIAHEANIESFWTPPPFQTLTNMTPLQPFLLPAQCRLACDRQK